MRFFTKRSALLAALLLLAIVGVKAEEFEVDGIWYSNANCAMGEVAVVKSSGEAYTGDIVIPATVSYQGTDYSVTKNREPCFSTVQ